MDLLLKFRSLLKSVPDEVKSALFCTLLVLGLGILVFDGKTHPIVDDNTRALTQFGWVLVAAAAIAGCAGFLAVRFQQSARIVELEQRVEQPPLSTVTMDDYARLLQEWNDSGEGELLLYNIELQSFSTSERMRRVWGHISSWTNMKRVVLLLPPDKVHRWELYCQREEAAFFLEQHRERFVVGTLPATGDRAVPAAAAFALYRFARTGTNGSSLHPKALFFVLSEPFSQRAAPTVPGDVSWWDYHHILLVRGLDSLRSEAMTLCKPFLSEDRLRDVSRVLAETAPLEPLSPEALLRRLDAPAAATVELLARFRARRLKRVDPESAPPGHEGSFSLTYDNLDRIEGRFRRRAVADAGESPSIVCVGGFSEQASHASLLPVERRLADLPADLYSYTVSGPHRHATISGYASDMEATLGWVRRQAGGLERAVLVARSLNALASLHLDGAGGAASSRPGALVLIAPVFDLPHLVTEYQRECGNPSGGVEAMWRGVNGLRYMDWVSGTGDLLRFYGHELSPALYCDIIRRQPAEFSAEGSAARIVALAQEIPIWILTSPQDTLAGSDRALAIIEASRKAAQIPADRIRIIPIPTDHRPHPHDRAVDHDRRIEQRNMEFSAMRRAVEEALAVVSAAPRQHRVEG